MEWGEAKRAKTKIGERKRKRKPHPQTAQCTHQVSTLAFYIGCIGVVRIRMIKCLHLIQCDDQLKANIKHGTIHRLSVIENEVSRKRDGQMKWGREEGGWKW